MKVLYSRLVLDDSSWFDTNHGFNSQGFFITNDEALGSGLVIIGSYDGIDTEFEVEPGETLTLPDQVSNIKMQTNTGSDTKGRIWVR